MFNLKDEIHMPKNVGQNVLTNPKTNEHPHTDSYFEALKAEKVALSQLKSMNETTYGRRMIKSGKPPTSKNNNSLYKG